MLTPRNFSTQSVSFKKIAEQRFEIKKTREIEELKSNSLQTKC
jgi:hypothetical protein